MCSVMVTNPLPPVHKVIKTAMNLVNLTLQCTGLDAIIILGVIIPDEHLLSYIPL